MRPQLFRAIKANGTPIAFLVDGDKYFGNPDEDGYTRTHYSRGVLVGPFSAGEILKNEKGEVIFPVPAVMQQKKKWLEIPLADRGLTEQSAIVLLNLSAAYFNITVNDAKGTWKIGKPALERTDRGWCQWKFIAAWRWQKWLADGDKPAAMHKDLRRMGYRGNDGAFRQMMHRMGFVTHTKSTESQHAENE